MKPTVRMQGFCWATDRQSLAAIDLLVEGKGVSVSVTVHVSPDDADRLLGAIRKWRVAIGLEGEHPCSGGCGTCGLDARS